MKKKKNILNVITCGLFLMDITNGSRGVNCYSIKRNSANLGAIGIELIYTSTPFSQPIKPAQIDAKGKNITPPIEVVVVVTAEPSTYGDLYQVLCYIQHPGEKYMNNQATNERTKSVNECLCKRSGSKIWQSWWQL